MNGNYFDLVLEQFNDSATEYFIKNNFIREDGLISQHGLRYMQTPVVIKGMTMGYAPEDFLHWDSKERKVIITNWKNFLSLLNRFRAVTAFDNRFIKVTDEMRFFSERPSELLPVD
ncbi:hypothetical protein [Pantoea sp. VS1]|uniref:hypothetical protein n=1 Tax=Pantoea sp. VS1 TaxID=2003658 RepID=UPI0011300669|nr:hypothetical protein [Pantoea sp. VS1]